MVRLVQAGALDRGGAVRIAHAEFIPPGGCRIITNSSMPSRGLPGRRTDMRTGLRERTGSCRVLEGSEKSIGEGDGVDVRGVRVLGDLGIDPEAERELHPLAGGKRLLVEAEAGGLVEVLAGGIGCDVV